MLHAPGKRPRFVMLIGLVLCSMTLSACGLQPAVIDEPKPTATPVTANVPDVVGTAGVPYVEKGEPSKPNPQPSTEVTTGPGEFTYANGAPFPVPSTEANPILSTTMEEAWGANLQVETFPTLIDSNHIFHLRGVDEDGRFLVGEVMTGTTTATQSDLTHLAILDTQSKEITHIPDSTRDNEANYTYSEVAVNGDWVVWLSKGGVPGNNPIKAYNRVSGKQITLDVPFPDYDDLLGPFIAGPPIGVNSVDHSIIVWAELSGEGNKGKDKTKVATVIKSYNLETGETAEISKYGVKPVISWPNVAWLEPDMGTEVDGEYMATIVVRNLQTGETRRLDSSWSTRELAIYNDVIVQGAAHYIENIDQTRKQIYVPDGGPQAQKPTINDRLVAWASAFKPSLWDRKLEKMIRMPGVSGLAGSYFDGCLVNGNMLAWQAGPDSTSQNQSGALLSPEEVKIYLLDTNSLP